MYITDMRLRRPLNMFSCDCLGTSKSRVYVVCIAVSLVVATIALQTTSTDFRQPHFVNPKFERRKISQFTGDVESGHIKETQVYKGGKNGHCSDHD